MNNTAPSSKKSTFIIIGIIVVAVIAYFYFKGGKSESSAIVETNPETEAVSQQVLSLLGQIKQLNIDADFFKSAAFQTLQDYNVPIQPVSVGRINPFAPIPGTEIQDTSRTRTNR